MIDSIYPAEAVIDLSAITDNVAAIVHRAATAQVMAVVKADAYGHGLVPSARACREGGASWLGVAQVSEAVALRIAGDTGPVLAWLFVPGQDLTAAVEAAVDLSAAAQWAVDQIADAARRAGRVARVHLKVDTGLSRGGATETEWPELVAHALRRQAEGMITVVGLWSHLARADEPEHPAVVAQAEVFARAVLVAERAGVRPEVRHVANSAATLTTPNVHYDLVRPGLAVYGLSPVPSVASPTQFGLRPAMTLRSRLALVKEIPEGAGVSYGHTYVTSERTQVALVPVGYADGVPRSGSNRGPLWLGGRRHVVAGRVCMDQFVVDVGLDAPVRAGDEVVIFGPGASGEPTAQEWADATETISYEIVTRVGARVPRRYVGGSQSPSPDGLGRTGAVR
ncbi:MAG: alanine racemase [Actinomycetota bacterium]